MKPSYRHFCKFAGLGTFLLLVAFPAKADLFLHVRVGPASGGVQAYTMFRLYEKNSRIYAQAYDLGDSSLSDVTQAIKRLQILAGDPSAPIRESDLEAAALDEFTVSYFFPSRAATVWETEVADLAGTLLASDKTLAVQNPRSIAATQTEFVTRLKMRVSERYPHYGPEVALRFSNINIDEPPSVDPNFRGGEQYDDRAIHMLRPNTYLALQPFLSLTAPEGKQPKLPRWTDAGQFRDAVMPLEFSKATAQAAKTETIKSLALLYEDGVPATAIDMIEEILGASNLHAAGALSARMAATHARERVRWAAVWPFISVAEKVINQSDYPDQLEAFEQYLRTEHNEKVSRQVLQERITKRISELKAPSNEGKLSP